MCVCVCTHTNIYKYTYIYIYTHTHTHLRLRRALEAHHCKTKALQCSRQCLAADDDGDLCFCRLYHLRDIYIVIFIFIFIFNLRVVMCVFVFFTDVYMYTGIQTYRHTDIQT